MSYVVLFQENDYNYNGYYGYYEIKDDEERDIVLYHNETDLLDINSIIIKRGMYLKTRTYIVTLIYKRNNSNDKDVFINIATNIPNLKKNIRNITETKFSTVILRKRSNGDLFNEVVTGELNLKYSTLPLSPRVPNNREDSIIDIKSQICSKYTGECRNEITGIESKNANLKWTSHKCKSKINALDDKKRTIIAEYEQKKDDLQQQLGLLRIENDRLNNTWSNGEIFLVFLIITGCLMFLYIVYTFS